MIRMYLYLFPPENTDRDGIEDHAPDEQIADLAAAIRQMVAFEGV